MTSAAPWPEVPMKALYRRRDVTGHPEMELLSVYRDLGVVRRAGREDNYNRPGEDLSSYRVVRSGDLVLNKMKTWQGSLGVSQFDGIVSPAYFVCEQIGSGYAPFLHHLLRSRPLIAEYARRSKGIRPAQWDLPWDEFRDIRVRLPAHEVQEAIAHYLDAETARIDALVAKKRRLIEVLIQRRAAVVEDTVRSLDAVHGSMPLKHAVTRVEVGIVITPAAWYADVGVPALRGVNVHSGAILVEDLVCITEEGNRLHQKSELHAGDVVVVRTGQAGAAAVVPESLDGYNCIDLLIVRPSARLVSKYLEFVLNSDWTQKHIEQKVVGTIQSHFNVGAMKDLPLPIPSVVEQTQVVGVLSQLTSEVDQIVNRLDQQVELLAEHRQALITAAVTGELEIPGVAA